jgi:hypothetical protein
MKPVRKYLHSLYCCCCCYCYWQYAIPFCAVAGDCWQ